MRIYLLGFAVGVTLIWSPTFKANPANYRIPAPTVNKSIHSHYDVGVASWYGRKFQGRETASGEAFDMRALTAAHRRLPLGTVVQLTNLSNQRSVTVRINDRGPWIRGRMIDVSKAAAHKLGFVGAGLTTVRMKIVSSPSSGGVEESPSPHVDAVATNIPDGSSAPELAQGQ